MDVLNLQKLEVEKNESTVNEEICTLTCTVSICKSTVGL